MAEHPVPAQAVQSRPGVYSPHGDTLVTITSFVVVSSILVQALTISRVLRSGGVQAAAG